MDTFVKIFILGTLVLGVQNSEIESTFSRPSLDEWWGPEELKNNCDTSIRPFKIKWEEEMINDLRCRLKNHRSFTPPLDGAAFEYGFNTNQMDGWLNYWAEEYNFTAREAYLNKFPHFKTYVQGLDMHFIRVKPEVSSNVEVIPLLMLHGWPGSVREFYDAIPLITAACRNRDFAVEVIVPSLPGFGFSSGAVRRGLGAAEMAVVLRNLMTYRLGYEKFYIQAGDFGAHICNFMATQFPDQILGYHTNYAVSFVPSSLMTWFSGSISSALQSLVVESSLAERLYPITTIIKSLLTETGYLHLQSTKPDTLGVAMSDSPSGLLAYILQIVSMASRADYKYRDDGGIDDLFSRDEMIDNLMIYWMNNAFTTAIRLYSETFNLRTINMGLFALSTPVPTCSIHAKDELIYQSPAILKFKFPNLLHSTVLQGAGHFLAMEKPEPFSEDVLKALTAFKKFAESKESSKDKKCESNNELIPHKN